MIEAEYTSRKRKAVLVSAVLMLIVIIVVIAVSLAPKKDEPQPGVWTQIGDDLVGEADSDWFGRSIALSGDGSILAVGAPRNDGNGSNSGSVRVYQQNVDAGTSTWSQLGGNTDGSNADDLFGYSVSLSDDGTILAVGAIWNDSNGFNSGQVRVFRLVNNEGPSIGDPINGRGSDDLFGSSVALSADGTIVAAGAGGGDYASVYQLQNGILNQLGSDIPGGGHSVSLSHDGSVLAIGDDKRNRVQVYRLVNDAWTIIGNEIIGSGLFGTSVSLSADGRIVAVGARHSDNNGDFSGAAYVYENVNNEWIQVGSDLNGANAEDVFGISVSLSNNGTVLAVGAAGNDSNGDASGQIRVLQLVNNEWRPLGDPINGRDSGDGFGWSVALSEDGKIVAGGAIGDDEYVLIHRLEEEQ
jgi:hypothetical protein